MNKLKWLHQELTQEFYLTEFKKEFPNKPIVDKDNIHLNYWINIYFCYIKEKDFLIKHCSHINITPDRHLPTGNEIINIGKQLQEKGERILQLEHSIPIIYDYIIKWRTEKCKNWPKQVNDEKEMKELDIYYQGGGFWITKMDDKITAIEQLDTNKFKLNSEVCSFEEILSYIYLVNFVDYWKV